MKTALTGMPGVVIGGAKEKICPDASHTNLLVLEKQRSFDKWLLMLNSLELSTEIVKLILILTMKVILYLAVINDSGLTTSAENSSFCKLLLTNIWQV